MVGATKRIQVTTDTFFRNRFGKHLARYIPDEQINWRRRPCIRANTQMKEKVVFGAISMLCFRTCCPTFHRRVPTQLIKLHWCAGSHKTITRYSSALKHLEDASQQGRLPALHDS